MRNSQLYVSVIVLGVLALVLGVLLLAKIFGEHHTLPYIVLIVGAVLVIVGIIGMLGTRSRGIV
jgi:uncharacterized membrane protein HdeD (DUF308 family)